MADSGPSIEPAAPEGKSEYEGNTIDMLWSLLASIRLALILILVLAALSLVGTILVQAPSFVTQNPAIFDQWLETVRPRYGLWTNLFALLGLFDVFHSPLFAVLLGLLALNVIICSLDRWPRLWRAFVHPVIEVNETYFDQARLSAEMDVPSAGPQETISRAAEALQGKGYRVRPAIAVAGAGLYADRFAWSRFGTFLNHAGIVLVMLGAVIGGMLGFRNSSFVVPEGSTQPVGYGTGLAVYVDAFAEESYPDGRPKDYWSEAILFDRDREVARKTIRVNDPLTYKRDPIGFTEVRFHQSFFGNAVDMEVTDESGRAVFAGSVPLAYRSESFGGRPLGEVSLFHQGMVLQTIGRAAARTDSMIEPGEVLVLLFDANSGRALEMGKLTMRQPKKLGPFNVTFKRERQFTGLQVVYDPGNRIVRGGAICRVWAWWRL